MSIGLKNNIINQKGTPAFFSDVFANRPAAGFAGRVFISTDTGAIYEDTGSAWTLIADAGAGTTGTLQQVTTNGNTTNQGISITGSTLNFDSSGVNANPITMIFNTSVNRLLTPVLRLYGNTNISSNYIELFGTNATTNRSVNFPDASGVVGLSAAALTTGSVLFADGGGLLSQSNTSFFWDNTNKRLGIGINSPGAPLDIHATGTNAQFNGTGTNNAYLQFQNAGASKWRIGNTYNAGANSFDLYNNGTTSTALSFNSTTNNATFIGGLTLNSNSYVTFQNNGTSPSTITGSTSVYWLLNGSYTQNSIRKTDGQIIAIQYPNDSLTHQYTFPANDGNVALSSAALTLGSVPFANSNGVLTQDNTNLFWDNTNKRLGIGLNNATANLEVKGAFRVSDEATYGATILHVTPSGAGGIGMYADGGQYLHFGINNTDTLNISQNNNVIIGTNTDNGAKLQVTGAVYSYGSNSTYLFTDQTTSVNWQLYANSSTARFYNNASGNVASIAQATGIYTPTSDINRKKDFELSEIGLKAILGLKPTLFRMKEENDTNKHLGFIAQEVKEFIPQAYVEEKDFIGLSDRPIIAALVKAIQELNDKLVKNNIN